MTASSARSRGEDDNGPCLGDCDPALGDDEKFPPGPVVACRDNDAEDSFLGTPHAADVIVVDES